MRILVVEDDKQVASALKRGLEAEGYAVDVALDGPEGRWLATENSYDALVLDVMLPRLRGDELCARLREAGDWTPILMLTARAAAVEEANALDAGADDFLSKPFSYVVLVARLRALMRRGGQERPAVLQVGDLRLDPSAHQVWRGGAEVALTPRQFSLLEFLMRRAGDVVSKATILEHVWDFAFEGDPNIVEVYVRQLRQRIDEPFGRSSLQTVRLLGYRLAPRPADMTGRWATVQARTTLFASAVTGLTLIAGSVFLVITLQSQLTRTGDELAQARVRDLLATAATGDLPRTLGNVHDDAVAQVLDRDGEVLAASSNIAGDDAIAEVEPGDRMRVLTSTPRTTTRPSGTGSGSGTGRPRPAAT